MSTHRIALALLCAVSATAALAPFAPARAQEATPFSFEAPPSAQANRVYSLEKATGAVSACQFERPEGNVVGVTRCFAKGEGAGEQVKGDYALVSTKYSGETGVFRVNRATGEMSICYVRDMPKAGGGDEPMVVCTQAKR